MTTKSYDTRAADRSVESFRRAFAAMWPERHDERVHVFANGHVYDKAERRRSIRQNVAGQRAWQQYRAEMTA